MTSVSLRYINGRHTNSIKWADFENLDVLIIDSLDFEDEHEFQYLWNHDEWDRSTIKLSTIKNSNLKSLTLGGLMDTTGIDGSDRNVFIFSEIRNKYKAYE